MTGAGKSLVLAGVLTLTYFLLEGLGFGDSVSYLCRYDMIYASWGEMYKMGAYLVARIAFYLIVPALLVSFVSFKIIEVVEK